MSNSPRKARPAPAADQVFPVARIYHGKPGRPCDMVELPFVHKTKGAPMNSWTVPAVGCYGVACQIGEAYAAHLAQFLKDNHAVGGVHGTLAQIVRAIDFQAPSPQHGYWVGFFYYVEKLIIAAAKDMDLSSDIQQMGLQFARICEFSRKVAEERGHD